MFIWGLHSKAIRLQVFPSLMILAFMEGKSFLIRCGCLDWLVVSAGPYGAKYNLFGATYNDVGVNGAVKFILHDRIRLNGYGQYSVNGDRNGVAGPLMNMYPQTYYGGTIEVKITKNFGIEGGVIRELNPFNGKWVNRPYFAPVFYTK